MAKKSSKPKGKKQDLEASGNMDDFMAFLNMMSIDPELMELFFEDDEEYDDSPDELTYDPKNPSLLDRATY